VPEQPAQQETFDLVVVGGGRPTLGESTMEAAMVALGLPVHVTRPRPARAGRQEDLP
jgi:hypothetical protein